MFEDDEKKKKREEEAKQIISSFSNNSSNINAINYANLQNTKIKTSNDTENLYLQRVQEANNIINSINPREDVNLPKRTEERNRQLEANGKELLDLIDRNQNKENSTITINNANNDIETEQNEFFNKNSKERWNVIARGNKLSSLKTEEEIQQENAQKEFASRADSDKNILSQLGKFFENFWLGGVNGLMQATKVATDVEYENKNQESTLLAGNNSNIPEVVTQEYKSQNNNSILDDKIKQQKVNENFSLIRFTPEYQQINNSNSNIISEETKRRIDNDIKGYTNQYGEIELNPLQLKLEKSLNENNQKIENNVNEISNPAIKKLAEIAPSTSNSLVGAGLSTVNPMLGLSYFTASAMGNYEDSGRQMGMSKDEAKTYSRIMGIMESATEMVGIDKFIKGVKVGNISKLAKIKQTLKYYGMNIADNAIQEAIIDPIDEAVAFLASGKTKNDYSTPKGTSQLISDMIKDGIDGALSAMLMDAVGLGINSSVRVYNKITNNQLPTQQELTRAFQDINNDERIQIEDYFAKNFDYEKNRILDGNAGEYYSIDFDNDGNIIDMTKGQGTTIDYKGDANIAPVIMLINNNYNVIDANTGLKLDTTPYQTIQEAKTGFTEKIKNSNSSAIQEINNRVNKAKLSIINTINQADVDITTGISNKQMYSREATIQLLNENGIDTSNIPNRSYLGKEINDIIRNPDSYVPNSTKNVFRNDTANNTQTSSEANTSIFYDTTTNYAVQDIKKVTEPFNKQNEYTVEEMAEVWNNDISGKDYDISYDNNGNIKSYIAIEEEGNNIVVNQYDNNDNIVKSEVIPSKNGRYKASDIQDTISRIASPYDENKPIKGQQDIEGNEVKSMKKKIDNKKDTKITKKIEEYIAKNPNLETNINISTNMFNHINIKEIKQMEAYKAARDLFSQIHKRKFQNKNTNINIYVTNSDIKESINTTYTYTEQRKYLKENIAIYSQLDNIIENAQLISNTNELKGRQNYQLWEYYAMPINIDNNKFIVQFDTVQREDGETHFRVERLYKITEEGSSTTVVPTKKSATRFTVEPPSTKNSIPQNSQSVKNNTAINKQSTRKKKNNTQKAIKSLKDIKTKYKNQTDQLNIFENKDNTISINNLIVKENLRNQGIGQNILNDIIDYADKNKKTITLTPTNKYLTKNRLADWYKRNGFVENKGKNTDFSISDTMYRLPKDNANNGVRSMKKTTPRNNTNASHINTTVDNQGRTLSKQQQEYFKDSKVRDESGNLQTVYHTTTNAGEQFNIFDPRNTDFYRFGMQIVNYYTDSKAMSGSYADGSYEMAETSKNISNTKNVKRQYEGYINITNPYIVDAEGSNWNGIRTETNEYGKKLLNEIDVLEKNNIYNKLKEIYDDVERTSQDASDRFYKIQKKAGLEQYDILGEYARWGNIDNIYENGLFNEQGKVAIANHINDTIDGKTLKEIGLDLFNNKYETLLNKEIDKLKKQYPDIKDIPLEDFDIIAEHYDEGKAYIENRYRNQETTNDIVKRVIDMNNNGANYDGLIIKNVRDYGGGEVENYNPANVYVTFNSNQFKNANNTNPTIHQDIRLAKKTSKPVNDVLEPGQRNAERESNYIEQELRKIEATGAWDNSIPVTKMTDIKRTIEDYLGIGVEKGHFRQHAYGIYKGGRDIIRTKELKDIDTILHETGHALDIGKRLNIDKESISNELLTAVNNYGGYETENRQVQLEEGFAEIIREYTIVPERAKVDYPKTVTILEGIRQENKQFNDFISKVQQQTYNYIHQNPRNRVLSNQSIGERTNKPQWTKEYISQEVKRNIYDKDIALKDAVETLAKVKGKNSNNIKASENAYYLVRLTNGIGDKVTSMLSNGYIDEKGNKLMPGLNQLGEILENNPQRFDDLRAYLVAQRDLEYKAKTLKTGIRTMDSKAVVEQFKNDNQIQEAAKIVYDTLDGVLQYAVNNGLITQETAKNLRESNVFYVPMQRVLEGNKNNVGKRGAVSEIIKKRTGSELDIKDVLENIITNSSNIIQQAENNNILKALYNEGESTGLTGAIYDVIPPSMTKIGTAKLSTWENELKNQGVDVSNIDFNKTIDLFIPNNKIDSQNLITSFIDNNGKRVYLQFKDEVLFNSIMNMDKKFMSSVLNINRKLNMPLRYGATMANIGFAIPNMISDTAQAAIYSEAGFIPVVDNIIGIMDILSVQNTAARNFFNKVMPGYADRINTLYAIYSQTGSTSATRLSQYRENTQNIMKDIYGTKNNEVLGIKEKYKPLKRLLDVLTYVPELSEQSTRFRVFEKNLEYYRNKGMAETDARIKAALQSRDATQDFGRTGNLTREINQLIPFSAARVGSAYTFAEKVKSNPKQVAMRTAVLLTISTIIKAIGYDDKEIEELNQRKKDDNFVLKVGTQIVTIKKPQGILRSIINLGEYVQDLFTGHIEEGKEGERLVQWTQNAIMDNMPADSVTGLVPNMIAPVVENTINKDLYYNSDIVKSYDLELPDSEQYYDYNSQLAIWLGKAFNYSPAKIDNLISGYFGGLGTQVTNIIDFIAGKTGIAVEQPEMGAEDNAIGKRFIVNVNSNSASLDEIYNLKTDLTKKKNGGTITSKETEQLETITNAISEISKLNKQIREIKADTEMSGKEKAEQIKLLQQQKTDTARQALGKDLIYTENQTKIESTKLYPSRDTLTQNGHTLTMNAEMKKEYEQVANEYYNKYAKQGLYSKEKLEQIKDKSKDYAKKYMLKKYKNQLEE